MGGAANIQGEGAVTLAPDSGDSGRILADGWRARFPRRTRGTPTPATRRLPWARRNNS